MSAIGIFFYRPFRNASNYCADTVILPLCERFRPLAKGLLEQAERMRPYANSLLGRIVKSAAAETACSIAGAAAGQMAVGTLCTAMGPEVVPAACLIGLAHAVVTKKKPQIAFFTIGLVLPAFFSRGKQAEYFVQLGEYAGRTAGTILGGYAGLTKLAGAEVDLINRTRPSDSYAVNMVKFQAAGELFDAVIVRSSIPFAGAVVNLPRNAIKSVVQTLAYNSQSSLPLLRKCLREKQVAISIPQAVKMVCNRYSVAHSGALASQATALVSNTVLPSVVQRMGAVACDHLLAGRIKGGIDFMAGHSDCVVSILMRGFCQYTDLIQSIHADFPDLTIDEDDDLVSVRSGKDDGKCKDEASAERLHLGLTPDLLKKALKMKIPGAALVSPVFDRAMKGSVQEWSQALIGMIGPVEKELIGAEILGTERAEVLREFLPIYLKYYLLYVLLNSQTLSRELTLLEERDFFAALNGAFFSIYTNGSHPHRIVRCLRDAVSYAGEGFYAMRRFFEPVEEETLVAAPIALEEDHFPQAPAQKTVAEGIIAAREDYF